MMPSQSPLIVIPPMASCRTAARVLHHPRSARWRSAISGSRRLQIEAEARTIGRSHVDALRTSRDVVLLLESLVDFFGTTWPRDEHLAPWGILVGEHEVSGTAPPSAVGNDGDLPGTGKCIDPAQFGQS